MIETKTQKNISNIIISGVLEKRQTCTQPATSLWAGRHKVWYSSNRISIEIPQSLEH
ncbi:hypothetical protein LEP1GSC170_5041 [Leptospira interrogans serovar Bataviae str. HAI135]|nr:hypothetical protein LEP1GSC170_5041 [Leptospira interrogans serovar Bataviae str. HAI135]